MASLPSGQSRPFESRISGWTGTHISCDSTGRTGSLHMQPPPTHHRDTATAWMQLSYRYACLDTIRQHAEHTSKRRPGGGRRREPAACCPGRARGSLAAPGGPPPAPPHQPRRVAPAPRKVAAPDSRAASVAKTFTPSLSRAEAVTHAAPGECLPGGRARAAFRDMQIRRGARPLRGMCGGGGGVGGSMWEGGVMGACRQGGGGIQI